MIQEIKNIYHLFVAILANIIFLFPSRRLKVIGVTGTDGKTTTTNIIYHILIKSNKKASVISSLGFETDGKKESMGLHVTTPSPIRLQYLIYQAVKRKSEYLVLEVSSHAIDQHRIFGIPFKIAVLTNITNEHLDYHKTFDNYFRTKMKLIKKSQTGVINRDDGTYTLMTDDQGIKEPKNWITYGLSDSSDINPNNFIFKTKLIGDFNKYNCLAAIAVCKKIGIKDEDIKKAIEDYSNPIGRADEIYNNNFRVIVDFAHTPNAFEQILKAVRPLTNKNIIHVFGSAGKRDELKRPMMGEMSSQFSNIIILTAEDPRGEDILEINKEIESGIKNKKTQIIKIENRSEAIQAAINMAKKEDIVLITGKAHEKSMNINGKESSWDEYKEIENAIKTKNKNEKSK